MRLSWSVLAIAALGRPGPGAGRRPARPARADSRHNHGPGRAPPLPNRARRSAQPAAAAPTAASFPGTGAACLLAIDQGEWEAARLGIDALPDGPLKPYAKAELFTAKGSPKVDLEPILALLDGGARTAAGRAAAAHGDQPAARHQSAPAIYWPRPTVSLGSAPRRGKTRPVGGRTRRRSAAAGDRAAGQGRRRGRRRGAVPDGACRPCRSRRGRRPPIASPGCILSADATPTPAASPTRAAPARPANGPPRRPGFPASRPGG